MGERAKDISYIDRLGEYLQQNPTIFGWLMVALGAVFLYGSIRRWGWLFEGGDGMFNIAWVAETFGFRTAQILFVLLSLLFVGAGIAWVYFS